MSDLVSCNLCGSRDFEVVFKAGVAQNAQIVRCRDSSLMYANPRWKSADVEQVRAYDPDFPFFQQPWFKKRADKEELQIVDYRDSRREMADCFPERGKLLEIGFSLGYGLAAWSKEGWDCTGVEPWQGGVRHAGQVLGLQHVHASTLQEMNFPDDTFDVVVMLHVIEHLDDPVAELKEIFRVLRPNGRAIIETPRYDTLAFRLLGRRERSISCDGHIYFFTRKTLEAAGEKAGFQVERFRTVGRSMTVHRLLWNLGVMSKSKRIEQRIDRLGHRIGLNKLRLKLNAGDMQRITFKKDAV